MDPRSVTLEQAVDLLKGKAARKEARKSRSAASTGSNHQTDGKDRAAAVESSSADAAGPPKRGRPRKVKDEGSGASKAGCAGAARSKTAEGESNQVAKAIPKARGRPRKAKDSGGSNEAWDQNEGGGSPASPPKKGRRTKSEASA